MKRLALLLPLSLILLAGCQKEDPQTFAPSSGGTATKSPEVAINPDEPITFFATEGEYDAWTHISGIVNRFTACEVPYKRLSSMTTQALAKSIMNYPLNYIVFAYDDPQTAIDLILKHSSLHQELLSRDGAGKYIVSLYSAASLDMSLEKSNFDGDYSCLSYTNSMFMDYFIGSGHVPGLSEPSVKKQLMSAVEKKIEFRKSQPDVFSWFSIQPLYDIQEMLGVR